MYQRRVVGHYKLTLICVYVGRSVFTRFFLVLHSRGKLKTVRLICITFSHRGERGLPVLPYIMLEPHLHENCPRALTGLDHNKDRCSQAFMWLTEKELRRVVF